MFFKTSNSNDGLILSATNVDLEERWAILTASQMNNLKPEEKWGWFYKTVEQRKHVRTEVHLAFDYFLDRPAIAKTITYRAEDKSREQIIQRRRILEEQLNLLNDISSPLLPEPLDWFEVRNTDDNHFEEYKDSEPVLILDYQPGIPITYKIEKNHFTYDDGDIDTSAIGRILLDILHFLKLLYEKDYACLNLSCDHILLLNNFKPRIIGIGGICKVVDGHLDYNNVNFGVTCKGYSAPELNDPEGDWYNAKYAGPEQIGAFSLGVILHNMVYGVTKFDSRMLKNGSLYYDDDFYKNIEIKSKKAKQIKNLIRDLCEHDVEQRLTDFDEIEERLQEIAGNIEYITKKKAKEKEERERRREMERLARLKTGIVKWYDSNKGFGYIECNELEEDVYVSRNILQKYEIDSVSEGTKLKFEVMRKDRGPYAENIEVLGVSEEYIHNKNSERQATRGKENSKDKSSEGISFGNIFNFFNNFINN